MSVERHAAAVRHDIQSLVAHVRDIVSVSALSLGVDEPVGTESAEERVTALGAQCEGCLQRIRSGLQVIIGSSAPQEATEGANFGAATRL